MTRNCEKGEGEAVLAIGPRGIWFFFLVESGGMKRWDMCWRCELWRASFPPRSTEGPLFPVVFGVPWVLGVEESLRDAGSVDGGIAIGSRSSLTAAPRPAARDQRPRRGRERFIELGRLFSLPASWPLLPLRDGRGSARFFCEYRSLFALLLAKGEEGTSMWGEQEWRWRRKRMSGWRGFGWGSWVTGPPLGPSAQPSTTPPP